MWLVFHAFTVCFDSVKSPRRGKEDQCQAEHPSYRTEEKPICGSSRTQTELSGTDSSSRIEICCDRAERHDVDVLKATVQDLKALVDKNLATSRCLVLLYLRQIRRHNITGRNLNALIDVPPEHELLKIADALDRERAAKRLRGEYHGIPIVLKDTINTDPALGMRTTLGSYALASARPARNAAAVKMLLDKGLIILGKANLSEFGTKKCTGTSPTGWSPVGGQTQSAYVQGGVRAGDTSLGHSMPGGSSSGSAVAVAAGFAPWSIGAETDGSLQTPASRASLYALKPTIGSVSDDGVFKLTDAFDSLGGMAKSAHDLAVLTEILFLTKPQSPLSGRSLSSGFRKSLKGKRLGFVDPDEWMLPPGSLAPDAEYLKQRKEQWIGALAEFERLGAKIISPIKLKKPKDYVFEGRSGYSVVRSGGWKDLVSTYLEDLAETQVKSLDDIVRFGEEYPKLEFSDACPNQASLIKYAEDDTPPATVQAAVKYLRRESGPNDIDRVMELDCLDAILAPTESQICTIASFAGYPIGTMPLGYVTSLARPHGISILAPAHKERVILEIMHSWENGTFERKVPDFDTKDKSSL